MEVIETLTSMQERDRNCWSPPAFHVHEQGIYENKLALKITPNVSAHKVITDHTQTGNQENLLLKPCVTTSTQAHFNLCNQFCVSANVTSFCALTRIRADKTQRPNPSRCVSITTLSWEKVTWLQKDQVNQHASVTRTPAPSADDGEII